MQPRRWILLLIVLVCAVALLLAVAKIRSPQLKFDRIEIGMSGEDVEQILGKCTDIRLLHSDEGAVVNHAYQMGMYYVDVYLSNGKVTDKSIEFRPLWVIEEKYGQTIAF